MRKRCSWPVRVSVQHAHDVRDDVAGALEQHRVADADVLALDLVHVVQRDVADGDAADRHRLELGDRRQHAGAADRRDDAQDASSSPAAA